MTGWELVPAAHRGRWYEYTNSGVRCICKCGWRSTLAPDVDDARALWVVHVRQLVRAGR